MALLAERKTPAAAYEAIVAKIDRHLEKNSPTPYREALVRLKNMAVAGSKGQVPAMLATASGRDLFAVGKLAPDFVVEDVQNKESYTLRRWQGKNILMVFYHPSGQSTPEVLRFVQQATEQAREADLAVVGFSMADDPEGVRRLQGQLNLTFLMLAGKSLRKSYGVDATPRLVVVDREGVVRAAYTGWGPERPAAILADLKKCLESAETEEKSGPR
jgi:peroxiredoxin